MSTIKHIAKKAGVSPTTVSNVLHGNTARVSPATREKVLAILREEKYAPNMAAMILARSNSRIIGVIMFMEPRRNESVLEDPFSSTILGAMEQEIRRHGYFLMLHTTSDEEDVLRLSKTWKLDGLVLFWVPGEICSVIKDSIQRPVVFVDCYFTDRRQAYHNVGLDDRRGGYEVARYLLALGHTRVSFLAAASVFPGGDSERFQGCAEAFAEGGLSLGSENFITLPRDGAMREELYRELRGDPLPFTALFFSSDYYAAEAVSYFQNHGVGVPSRISVVGFDDNIFARLVRPQLTTVHQDVALKGQRAIALLVNLMQGEDVVEPEVRLPVRLVLRESVAPPQGG